MKCFRSFITLKIRSMFKSKNIKTTLGVSCLIFLLVKTIIEVVALEVKPAQKC